VGLSAWIGQAQLGLLGDVDHGIVNQERCCKTRVLIADHFKPYGFSSESQKIKIK
jgi:hypothetical protein